MKTTKNVGVIAQTLAKIKQNSLVEFAPVEVQQLILPGVYMIQNTITLEGYIGESNDILNRWRQHLENKVSNRFLQNDVRKYGWDNFRFVILELLEGGKSVRVERENQWIFGLHDYCYNRGVPTLRRCIPEYGSGYVDNKISRDVYDAIQRVYFGEISKTRAADMCGITIHKFRSLCRIFEQNVKDYSRVVETDFRVKRQAVTAVAIKFPAV